mgnify:CR=1 FL=1
MTSIKIQAASDRILIEKFPKQDKTARGILLPSAREDNDAYMARVVSVGPGRYDYEGNLIRPTLKPGQVVLVGPNSPGHPLPQRIERESKNEMAFVLEDQILATVSESDDRLISRTELLDFLAGRPENSSLQQILIAVTEHFK